jgi:hypothetical protein
MPPARPPHPQRRSTVTGIAFNVLQPGAFYQCVQPGGFGDSLTGIFIPGPKAELDGSTKRTVVTLTDLPEPVQLPHMKLIVKTKESGKGTEEVEVPFNEADEQPVHEAFMLALATEIIRLVPDEEMEEHYPETWEAREEHLVWRHANTSKAEPMINLLHAAQDAGRLARMNDNAAKIDTTRSEIQARQELRDAPRVVESSPPRPPKPPRP